MFGVSRRMLQMGELPRDLLKRQDAPEEAALASPRRRDCGSTAGSGRPIQPLIGAWPRSDSTATLEATISSRAPRPNSNRAC